MTTRKKTNQEFSEERGAITSSNFPTGGGSKNREENSSLH
jgi:hypothetical protein